MSPILWVSPHHLRSLRILLVLFFAIAAVLAFLLLPAAAAPEAPTGGYGTFEANLSGANEVPPVDISSAASGRAVMALSEDGTTLYYRVMVNDIVNITAAHIHLAPEGMNGDVIFTLYDGTGLFDPTHPVSGSLTLDETQLGDLIDGNYYVNVHTTTNPGGEIRGQLRAYDPSTATELNALLTGDAEVPPVSTEALGVARLTPVSPDTLDFYVAVTDIMSITAAHIHKGLPGENGPVILPLYDGSVPFDPDHPISGTLTLTAENKVDLLTGYYYVNVHTEANPGGEIRGQVGGTHAYEANLSGANEVPPVDTPASGRAVLALDGDATTLAYRVSVSDIVSITAAHIHLAPEGVNGDVIFTLYDGTGFFDPEHPISGTITLTDSQLFDLMADDYYVNVHTEANPGGEIRDQIRAYEPPPYYAAYLSGENEVPPVTTDATGLSRFTLDAHLDTLHYYVSVSNIISITAAHIHKAPAGVNGPVIFPLYTGDGPFDPDNPIGDAVTL
ncbi:MAG: CHRD domain-containing protein, partial [Ardenticatenaceae bacterium]